MRLASLSQNAIPDFSFGGRLDPQGLAEQNADVTFAWWTLIPFVVMLGSIAVLPLMPATAHRWEDSRFQLALALGLGLPVAAWLMLAGENAAVWHAVVEYSQFITLLFSLFVISGGVFLSGDITANPRNNTIFLAVGGLIASFVGTTGAAMLLIRPLLNTNVERRHRVHTVVFAIFIVANCGGLLTPWATRHCSSACCAGSRSNGRSISSANGPSPTGCCC